MLERMQAEYQNPERLQQLLRAIVLRTSARNQFRGVVKSVRRGAVNADVTLDVGDGLEIVANITNESVSELALEPGRAAMALIKSSFVLLAPGAELRISARNRLPGTVHTIVRGAVNSEVRLQLTGDRVIIAVVTNESLKELGLRKRQTCCAVINASHVLIAVND
jgi:molybdate transport system regulatory protein